MALEKLYSVEVSREMTAVTTRTIRNYLRNGILTGTKIGGQWRFRQEDVMNVQSGKICLQMFVKPANVSFATFNEQHIPFSESVPSAPSQMSPASRSTQKMGKTLCDLWNQANIQRSTFPL